MNRLLVYQLGLCALGAVYQAIGDTLDRRRSRPGHRVDVGGYRLHYCVRGQGSPTIVLDHSLGGVEGYLLLDRLSQLSRTFIYDRAGYGWSDRSQHPRTSNWIVTELDRLLTRAGIEPPYLLVGDSFGSYNMRLYAHRFPEKVAGLVLTDGLHEREMLAMSAPLQGLQLLFLSGFIMSAFGSSIGVVRLLERIGLFELLKPRLRYFPPQALACVKYSFIRPKHWVTMTQELWNLAKSGRQLQVTSHLSHLPIASIQANTFLNPSLWNVLLPIKAANQLHQRMHIHVNRLTPALYKIDAENSDHFVWVERPDTIVAAVYIILNRISAA